MAGLGQGLIRARAGGFLGALLIIATPIPASAASSAAALTVEKQKPVQWEQIAGWRGLGTRWAAGLSESGAVLAIYDLSYPTVMPRIELGAIGPRRLSIRRILELARAGKDDVPEEVWAAAASERGDGAESFPKGWWKKLPWREARIADSNHPPERFTLDDIRLDELSGDPGRFRQVVADMENADAGNDEGRLLGPGFLARFEFARLPDGGYDLAYRPEALGKPSRPKKIADLVAIHSGMLAALAWDAVDNGLGQLIGLIPVPLVSALLSTALHRYFMYFEQTVAWHMYVALEMVNTAEEGTAAFSPFASLTRLERERAAESLLLSDSSLGSLWEWIFTGAKQKWRKGMARDLSTGTRTREWLVKTGASLEELSPRFGSTTDSAGARRLSLLAYSYPFRDPRPGTAVDYAHPKRILAERIAIEAVSMGVNFSTHFIPYVGGTVYSIYDHFVERPIREATYWEGRLTGHLEERTAAGGSWATELAILDAQKLNPLDLSRKDMELLIAERRRSLGLGPAGSP